MAKKKRYTSKSKLAKEYERLYKSTQQRQRYYAKKGIYIEKPIKVTIEYKDFNTFDYKKRQKIYRDEIKRLKNLRSEQTQQIKYQKQNRPEDITETALDAFIGELYRYKGGTIIAEYIRKAKNDGFKAYQIMTAIQMLEDEGITIDPPQLYDVKEAGKYTTALGRVLYSGEIISKEDLQYIEDFSDSELSDMEIY